MPAIDAYLQELTEKRRPEKSVKSKRTELYYFARFVKDKPLEQIKGADLISFRNHLYDEQYEPVTVLNKDFERSEGALQQARLGK